MKLSEEGFSMESLIADFCHLCSVRVIFFLRKRDLVLGSSFCETTSY